MVAGILELGIDLDVAGTGVAGTTGLAGCGCGVLSIFLGVLTPWGCWPALSLDKSSLIVRIEDWYSLGTDGATIGPDWIGGVPLGES